MIKPIIHFKSFVCKKKLPEDSGQFLRNDSFSVIFS